MSSDVNLDAPCSEEWRLLSTIRATFPVFLLLSHFAAFKSKPSSAQIRPVLF